MKSDNLVLKIYENIKKSDNLVLKVYKGSFLCR